MKVNITEQDLFNFVLFPDELPEDKKNYVQKNILVFQEQIDLLNKLLKANLNIVPSFSDGRAIELNVHEHILLLVYPESNSSSNNVQLAAASNNSIKGTKSESFIDKGNNYLIRILSYKSISKLFLFSKNDSIKSYRIKIIPSGKEYVIYDTNSPIILSEEDQILSIIIREHFF